PRVGPYIIGEVEHILLHCLRRTDDIRPLLVYIDMTSGTGTRTATLCFDPRHTVADPVFHNRGAVFGLHLEFGTVEGDECQLGHKGPEMIEAATKERLPEIVMAGSVSTESCSGSSTHLLG